MGRGCGNSHDHSGIFRGPANWSSCTTTGAVTRGVDAPDVSADGGINVTAADGKVTLSGNVHS